jgi:hypothetical protein
VNLVIGSMDFIQWILIRSILPATLVSDLEKKIKADPVNLNPGFRSTSGYRYYFLIRCEATRNGYSAQASPGLCGSGLRKSFSPSLSFMTSSLRSARGPQIRGDLVARSEVD